MWDPAEDGTGCIVERVDRPIIEERALEVLGETGYHGISEAEFVSEAERETHVLLDINTRPWMWIDLPVTAGTNLPMAASASVTTVSSEPDAPIDATWVCLLDFLARLSTDGGS